MSASTERKKRQEARAAGTDKKTNAAIKEVKAAKKWKISYTIIAIVLVLLLAFSLFVTSSLPYRMLTAVKCGTDKYTIADFEYYFGSNYNYFMSQYGSYASYFGLSTGTDLKEQTCSISDDENVKTWYDYFESMALDNMKQVSAFCNYAEQNGIVMDDEDNATVDEQISSAKESADSGGYKDLDAYLEATYGPGVNEEVVRTQLSRQVLAVKVATQVQDGFTFTDEEKETEYQNNKDEWDLFTYDYYFVQAEEVPVETAEDTTTDASGDTEQTSEANTDDTATSDPSVSLDQDTEESSEETEETAVTEETMADAKTKADAIEAAYKENPDTSLTDIAREVLQDDTVNATTETDLEGSNISETMAEWIKDASRRSGDSTVLESADTGYYVVVYRSRSDNHYYTVNVRHILIQAEASSDGTYTEEALQTAYDKIQEIYAEFESGDRTEESFAALAQQYSEDTGSASDGGLYENVYKGQMVDTFEQFCFAEERQPGDTGIVEGSNGSYRGYHLIYYVGQGELYSNYLAEQQLRSDKMSEWETQTEEGFEPVKKFAIRYATQGDTQS
jgi:parvulin-like peptidyl-prolyl isomerase